MRVCCAESRHLSWLAAVVGREDFAVPKPFSTEFRDDIVRVAQQRSQCLTLDQVSADFGIHPITLSKWFAPLTLRRE